MVIAAYANTIVTLGPMIEICQVMRVTAFATPVAAVLLEVLAGSPASVTLAAVAVMVITASVRSALSVTVAISIPAALSVPSAVPTPVSISSVIPVLATVAARTVAIVPVSETPVSSVPIPVPISILKFVTSSPPIAITSAVPFPPTPPTPFATPSICAIRLKGTGTQPRLRQHCLLLLLHFLRLALQFSIREVTQTSHWKVPFAACLPAAKLGSIIARCTVTRLPRPTAVLPSCDEHAGI